jgi:hypothetical protein
METTTSQRNSVIIYEEMYMRACRKFMVGSMQ